MSFRKDLEKLMNVYSKENVSNTPDFVLAEYVLQALDAFDLATRARDEWFGRKPRSVRKIMLVQTNNVRWSQKK